MNLKKEIEIFKNEEFGEVRTILIDDEPWFVGKDICQIFGDKNHNRSIGRVDEVDKRENELIDSIGRKQKAIFVNESGLYSLLFSMQPQKANTGGVSDAYPIELNERIEKLHRFKHWVTHDVLPSIRKHGLYAMDELIANPDLAINALLALKEEKEKSKSLEAELDYSKEWYSIKRVAAINHVEWDTFNWRKLKDKSNAIGIPPKKIFDANYGEVNTYHMNAWEATYPEFEL